MKLDGWRKEHYNIIQNFIQNFNKSNEAKNYSLKGGTSLMLCYGLDRFSEDIDLDGFTRDVKNKFYLFIESFCALNKFTFRVAKNTETTKRYIIHYGSDKPLKVEISFRSKFDNTDRVIINNINTYGINKLAFMKSNAYTGRDKIRDLYDICFITNKYWAKLSNESKSAIADSIRYKGLDNFDYILKTQEDPLIDKDRIENMFLLTLKKLRLV